MFRRLALALTLALGPLGAAAQSEEEVAYAREFLAGLQVPSIIEDREYCGYFGRDETGRIVATKPRRGKYNSCAIGTPPPLLRIFASYHTHAGMDPDSYNEIPSTTDLISDIEAETNGYISTPGGRLWFSDRKAQAVRQLCGIGCLPQDPAFRPGKFQKVRRSYTLEDLRWLMGE